ncbi:hypothetical protein D9619_011927 [Psilocybe cf. subviscida]|uniref:pyranose dehydrogenase (acceptor) n=1 Tax=Psilocybe cf. subviscida TaxID=2480587 RepID=A0A8H5B0B9_9AGAR|nr:hypothetical protein D9619_011927 [Psilocybe cf. subviscida]
MVNFAFKSLVVASLPFFLANAVRINNNRDTAATTIKAPSDATQAVNANNTYDYVIVGSGPGGGPLAARLAQAGFSVALIDAGEDHGTDPVVEIPAFFSAAAEYTPIHWQFFVDHYEDPVQAQKDEKFTWQLSNGTLHVGPNPPSGAKPLGIYYPRTGTLGGCAEHNALITIYPHQSDWQTIADITGDSSWSPTNMRKYWSGKIENNHYEPAGTAGYGFGGWLDTTLTGLSDAAQDMKVVQFIQAAAVAFGKTLPPSLTMSSVASLLSIELNSAAPGRDLATGLYQLPMSVVNTTASRSTHRVMMLNTANAVTSTGAKKFKLDIKLTTFVTKILFDRSTSTPRAVGVNYLSGAHLYSADPNAALGKVTGSGSFFARREVIVSGGAFNTPQLLKLSGIGPKAELQQFGIPVVLDQPAIGTNMQDRYELGVTGFASDPSNFFQFYAGCTFGATADDPCLAQWLNNATDRGVYKSDLFQVMAVQKTSVAASTEADVIIGGVPAEFFGYFPGFSNDVAGGGIHWTWLVLKAHSRNNAGTVTLTSNNPRDMPKIKFNSFQVGGDLDVQAAYEGVQLARDMFSKMPNLAGTFIEERPGPNVVGEAATKQWIRDQAWGHHASCTVPIGQVLDTDFRVKGINGLRVVDASAFPKIPSFYIITAIYMISEKAADVIIAAAK